MRYFSLWLVAVIVLVFVLQNAMPGLTDDFALNSSQIAEKPWLLITSIFLHGSLAHLLGNIFALGLFGIMLEHETGSKRFLAIYFAGGLIASVGASFFYESAIGASGAIFAVLGAMAAIKPRTIVWTYGVPMPMVAATGFWLLLDILGIFYPTNTANIAHIAGLFFGAIVGIALRKPIARKKGPAKKPISDDEFEQWEDEWV